ncbi:hypothetical protein DACRYDRAFT_21848 [Dacryopinax primogenitus]|uniref:Uncharacterized protein n=1 Tax=Dacryopinax primogenitus (strain DJM 731) TaxID=1858805 RepID=M5GE26_DACPD|nr:uncharacterized protein DACRYDRAFT_21848 [Dacryopinax primogenitus]EJU02918.1 hypothetical protein DACRYDRAFT_21848 [Dacryopinax primogenitus]
MTHCHPPNIPESGKVPSNRCSPMPLMPADLPRPRVPQVPVTHVTQAFALYPERPGMTSKSNLFKDEALLGTELDHTVQSTSASVKSKQQPREERFAGKMAGREGWCFGQPCV